QEARWDVKTFFRNRRRALNAKVTPAQGRKLRPSRRTPRGTSSLPMGGCSIGNWFVRLDPKKYNARPGLLRHRASLPLRSSTPSTYHWSFRNRILPSTDGQGNRGQLCGLAATLDGYTSGMWRIGLPRAKV